MDSALEIGGIVIEALFLGILTRKRAYRQWPVFFSYLLWGLTGDCIMIFLRYRFRSHYFEIYIWEWSLDSALQYAVLVELLRSVLRPFRESLPRGTTLGIAVLVMAAGAAAWPFSDLRSFAAFPAAWHFLVRLQQSIAILRVLFFLALAACSNLLRIGWRDRELQIATGLGFYSIVSLAGAAIHSHQTLNIHYHVVDQVIAASYFCSLLYWSASFVREESPRREFTPEMHSFLSTVASAASLHRVRLAKTAPSRGN